MILFVFLFALACIVNGPSFEAAGMAFVGSIVLPIFGVTVLGLIGAVRDCTTTKRREVPNE